MAYFCKRFTGFLECDGCGACREGEKADYHCHLCEEPIHEGERLYRVDGDEYCEGCVFERYGEIA